jgi:hypothetical protein
MTRTDQFCVTNEKNEKDPVPSNTLRPSLFRYFAAAAMLFCAYGSTSYAGIVLHSVDVNVSKVYAAGGDPNGVLGYHIGPYIKEQFIWTTNSNSKGWVSDSGYPNLFAQAFFSYNFDPTESRLSGNGTASASKVTIFPSDSSVTIAAHFAIDADVPIVVTIDSAYWVVMKLGSSFFPVGSTTLQPGSYTLDFFINSQLYGVNSQSNSAAFVIEAVPEASSFSLALLGIAASAQFWIARKRSHPVPG